MKRILFSSLCILVFGYGSVFAQDAWKEFVSGTKLYTVKMPNEPTETIQPFRVGFDRLLQSANTTSLIEGEEPQSYSVVVDQTLGPKLENDDKNLLVTRMLDRYERYYKQQGGMLRDRNDVASNDFYMGEITLSYVDPKTQDKQDVRARVTITDNSAFQQIAIGPDGSAFSMQNKEFFDSFHALKSSRTEDPGEKEWREIESPFQMFKLEVPPVQPPYVMDAPSIEHGDKIEVIAQVFTDPVWQQKLLYKVYGYRFETNLTTQNVQQVMAKNHIRKHGRDPYQLQFGQSFPGGTPSLEVTYQIRPPEGYPSIDTVRLRAMYLDNTMVVQEVMGPQTLVQSEFMRNTYDLIDFSPKQAAKKQIVDTLEGMMEQRN